MHPSTPRGYGAVLRNARKARGLTQRMVADLVNKRCGVSSVTANYVYRWEMEFRTPAEYLEELADVLGLDADALRAQMHGTLPMRGSAHDPTEAEDDVDRREFTGVMAGALAAVPFGAVPAQAQTRGRRLGKGDADYRRRVVSDLRRLDDYTGGANTYPLALRNVTEVEESLKTGSCSEPVRQEMLDVLAEACQFASWTAFDAGLLDQARKLAMKGTKAANQAGNKLLAASTLSELSYLTASGTNPRESVEIARASWANAPRGALPAAKVVFADRWAYACARVGDSRGVERALGLSQAAHDERDGRTDAEPDWVYWINRDESQIMVGRCWAELHDHARAVPVLENLTAPYDDTHAREVAMYECWLAGSYLDAREVERAASSMGRAVELLDSTESPRTDRWVNGVLQRMKPHQDVAPVRALLERTATI